MKKTLLFPLLLIILLFTGCAGLPVVDDARQLSLAPPQKVYVRHVAFDKEVGQVMADQIKETLAGTYQVVDDEAQAQIKVTIFQQYFGDKRTEAAKGGGLDKGTAVLSGATATAQVGSVANAAAFLGGLASFNPVTGAVVYLGSKAVEAGANLAAQAGEEKHYYIKYLLILEDGQAKWRDFLAHDYAQPGLTEEAALAPLAEISAVAVRALMDGAAQAKHLSRAEGRASVQ